MEGSLTTNINILSSTTPVFAPAALYVLWRDVTSAGRCSKTTAALLAARIVQSDPVDYFYSPYLYGSSNHSNIGNPSDYRNIIPTGNSSNYRYKL